MARPRTPTNVLDARGAFKKNPQRKREDAQTAGPLSRAPGGIPPGALAAWKEIVGAAPVGVLTTADAMSVEIAACLMDEYRCNRVEFPAAKLVRLEALLGKFGMTPADRAKVGGKKQEPKGNPFADL